MWTPIKSDKLEIFLDECKCLLNIVKYIYELGKNENIHLKPLWLENIPEIIMLGKTKEK